jgi:predicted MFS family arabinose efflux permease
MFYRRKDLSLRIGLFWSAASLSGAFSGLLAAGIGKMDGVADMRGWRWIFCLEGIFTVAWAALVFFLLPNSPQTVKFMTAEQRQRCAERLKADVDFLDNEKVTVRKVLSVFASPGLLCIWLTALCSGIAIFGLAYFTPSIVRDMGFGVIKTQLMSVPPFAAAVPLTILVCYYSDKYNSRGLPILATYTVALIGSIMFLVGRTFSVRYAGLFFLLGGMYSNVPCQVAWIPNNTASHTRRATAIAVETVAVNVGGILSTWIFPTREAPYYPTAARLILAANLVALVASATAMWVFWRGNQKKGTAAYRDKILAGMEDMSFAQQLEKVGDAHPDYKYAL